MHFLSLKKKLQSIKKSLIHLNQVYHWNKRKINLMSNFPYNLIKCLLGPNTLRINDEIKLLKEKLKKFESGSIKPMSKEEKSKVNSLFFLISLSRDFDYSRLIKSMINARVK